jgi:Zn-dependent M28 family amino/carboxypeptidase
MAQTSQTDLGPLAERLPDGTAQAMEVIDGPLLRAPIRFLADDLLGGRGPSSPGDEITQLYLATQMEALGLEPAFEGDSWTQPFDIVGITATVPDSWTFSAGGKSDLTLARHDDFIAASGVQKATATVDGAEVVFVGYGIQAPEYDWDDFGDADLTGKVLLMLNNDPDWDPELFGGDARLYYGRWTYKYESAARQGAAGAIIIHTTPSAGYPFQVVQTSWTGPQFELPAESEPRIEIAAWTTEEASRRLVEMGGHDLDALVERARSRDFEPVALGVTTSLSLTNEITKTATANVGGVLHGSDPELAEDVVVYTAHHDHIGDSGEGEDAIYNGALDNAAGVSQILAIARAITELPEAPRRSQLFLFVAAEEQGLLGSKYFSLHPSVPAGRLAANINYDGGNIWGRTTDVTLVGYGKSDLDDVARSVLDFQGRTLVPDQFPDRGFYYRSDQISLAKIGVPALYFDTGTAFRDRPAGWGKEQIEAWEAQHYHQPSDELRDDWVFDGMIEDARLGLLAGLLISQADEMPAWNEGDEFEAARLEALEKVEE